MARKELHRVVRFFCVAVFGLFVDTLVGFVCLHFTNLPMFVCVILGFSSGLLWGFIVQRRWTCSHFVTSRKPPRLRFYTWTLALLLSRIVFAWLLIFFLSLSGVTVSRFMESAIYLCMLGFSFLLNYIVCRLWIFASGGSETP
ncbi:hypothetical protein FACS1894168_3150 [Deltaproteobacteria bacterium]|nr:hypothetical protein FACS1894168_3150 [Deltaproteobacteria bacterium]